MTLGRRIREVREARGLTRDALQHAVGSKGGTVTRWERDQRRPGGEYLSKLAKELGVLERWLVTGEGPREPSEDVPDATQGVAALEAVLETFDWLALDVSLDTADDIILLARASAMTAAGSVRPQSAWRLFLTQEARERRSRPRQRAVRKV